MSYTPFLISNFATGLDKKLEPWMIPNDAQDELYDGYADRGIIQKRNGYSYFATGGQNGAPYCESRIVDRITNEPASNAAVALSVGDGTPTPTNQPIIIKNTPIRRGTFTLTAGAQSAVDDGLGALTTTPPGGAGTIDYTTGAVNITFANNVPVATQVYATYDWHPGLPVLGIMNFIDSTNLKQLIVADGKRLNIYDDTNNRFNFLGLTLTITGITVAANAVVTTSAAHNLSTGDKVWIYGVFGTTEVNNQEFTITVTGGTTFQLNSTTTNAYVSDGTVELIFRGNTAAPASSFYSWVNYQDKDGNPRLLFTNNNGQVGYYAPHLANSVGNYISYPTAAAPDFQMLDDAGVAVTSLTCDYMVEFKDRLTMFRTTESGTIKPRRIRISGTGANSDDFRTSATGAGKIDVPDNYWLKGVDFNRDDLIFDTEQSAWILKYSGNDTTPFIPKRIDDSIGCGATFSMISYLNTTTAASPRGLSMTDGYRVSRSDDLLPDFSFNEIDGENFDLCYSGIVDDDRSLYMLYPQIGNNYSQRILVTNYDEGNRAIFRLPLSCMGTYINRYGVDWNDLLIYPTWDAMAAVYGDWNSFAFNQGAPFSVGGGHAGEIWKLNVTESEDNPVRVRNVTIIDSNTIEVTTDWNNFSLNSYDAQKGADVIHFSSISGMQEINNKQYAITSVTDNYTFRCHVPNTTGFTAFNTTQIGYAQRVIPFFSSFKKFNPFIDSDKKVRCGYLYMYVDASGTDLKINTPITGASQTNPCVITTTQPHGLQTGDNVTIFGVGGMTEINDLGFTVTYVTDTTFSLNDIDATGYTAYTAGGYFSVEDPCKAIIQVITNDNTDAITNEDVPIDQFQGNVTNLRFQNGIKKWYKVYINQIGRFIQFKVSNQQAGSRIKIHAQIMGFQPVGRLI